MNLKDIKEKIVVVSKQRSIEEIINLKNKGYTDFAENRIEELEIKAKSIDNINWHFIGMIQSKKIKKIVKYSEMIQSLTSIKQLININDEAQKINKIQKCLLQFNNTNEKNKQGFDLKEINNILIFTSSLKNIKICGMMVMGPLTVREEDIYNCFKEAYCIFKLNESIDFNVLSMGMSSDYKIALESGSTMLRLGTIMFEKNLH